MPKNITIFCDGTGNRRDAMEDGKPTTTNVVRAYLSAPNYVVSGWTQTAWYDDGVGTGTSSRSRFFRTTRFILEKLPFQRSIRFARIVEYIRIGQDLLELATGIGISENIRQGYQQIVHHYRPGDRIFLFGFSRGAYTARCIAGVISRYGLLRSENIRYAEKVVGEYKKPRARNQPDYGAAQETGFDPDLFHPRASVRIAFLGVWDTVASLGLPLWGWWFRIGTLWSNLSFDTNPASICDCIRHAISMDERRAQFFVTMFDEQLPPSKTDRDLDIKQVWFRGTHAGVGGGYSDSGLSDIALRWMLDEARPAGLQIDDKLVPEIGRINAIAQIHNQLERQKAWYLFGTWPRWHPCPRAEGAQAGATETGKFGALHSSVYARAAHATALRQARADAAQDPSQTVPLDPEEMAFLDPGKSARILVRADRQWNRSGLIVESGGLYRIRPAVRRGPGSFWRDKEADVCRADGQDAGPGDSRFWFGWTRRHRGRDSRWMELIATVAHPRKWDLREENIGRLLRYIFIRDPKELTDTLMPIGRHLTIGEAEDGSQDGVVHLRNDADSGMLYLFANDAWLFYGNNSGAIELSVERLDPGDRDPLQAELDAKRPCFVVNANGDCDELKLTLS